MTQTTRSATLVADTVDVKHVMEAYHQAVITYDGVRLQSLFLPSGSLWLSVLSDAIFARAHARSVAATKVKVGSVADFTQFVSTSKSVLNPTKTNLKIFSDDTIASVSFDFVFLVDGKEQNRGSEAWQLVKAADGWRISTLIFSSNPELP